MSLYKKYNQSLNHLLSLSNLRKKDFFSGKQNPKHYFKRAKLLYKLAGNPEKIAKKIIVVTGTSGKGSTCNYLHQILFQAGFKVGTYLSPHTTTAIERIKINNLYISPSQFIKIVEQAKPIIEKCYLKMDAPSFFESFLLLALLYFKNQKCDFIIIEVGCGGRHDAANAMSKIDIAAITNIGKDHLHLLGPTLRDVAYEKAGIIHNNLCLTTEKKKRFLKTFETEAKKTNSKFHILDCKKNPNQELAKAIADHLKIKNIRQRRLPAGQAGIRLWRKKAKLPCRFEIIQNKPLVILDSAHNPDKLQYLTEKLKNLRTRKIHLVFGLASPKNISQCLKPILNNFDVQIYATRSLVEQRKAEDPKKIYQTIKKHWPKTKCQIFLDPWQAFKIANKNLKSNELLLITGSTFLCGELRKYWISEETIFKNRKSF